MVVPFFFFFFFLARGVESTGLLSMEWSKLWERLGVREQV